MTTSTLKQALLTRFGDECQLNGVYSDPQQLLPKAFALINSQTDTRRPTNSRTVPPHQKNPPSKTRRQLLLI